MAETLFDGISLLFQKSAYSNVTSFEPCRSSIDHYKFYQFSLIPAVILTLLMAATTTRKHKLLKILRGRPGLLFPMDTLTRSSRLSYACAFGATAFVVYQISIEHTFAFDYKGPQAAITLMAIFSMIIYGIVFFPVFACLALGSAFSFGLGAVYVWMFFIVNLYRLSECTFTLTGRAVLFVRMLPTLFCLCYLSIMLPIRFVRAIGNKDYFRSPILKKRRSETLDDIKNSYQGRHVRKLLTKPVVQAPPEGFANKAKAFFMSQVHKLVYRREEGFRYSSRLLAVMFVAACVVYVVSIRELFYILHQEN
ncbi:stimulated by retinoic acid 6 protein [Biomphalaria pfeifferi]|uniref:Receptor for retinol uptake STRA6 n=1 Tax=Biomphalaria pfeifferi TaxID=112525 RepID=A0AAD8FJW2_BIOPF|nr:stimulated by retinoic acid 6 protein [Biomphalaria pfeifferi]